MHRIDTELAVETLPAPGPVGSVPSGFFGSGNEGTLTLPTRMDASFFNAMQENICGVIEGAEIALNKAAQNQLLTAIQTLAGATPTFPNPLVADTRIKLIENQLSGDLNFSPGAGGEINIDAPVHLNQINRKTEATNKIVFNASSIAATPDNVFTYGVDEGPYDSGQPGFKIGATAAQHIEGVEVTYTPSQYNLNTQSVTKAAADATAALDKPIYVYGCLDGAAITANGTNYWFGNGTSFLTGSPTADQIRGVGIPVDVPATYALYQWDVWIDNAPDAGSIAFQLNNNASSISSTSLSSGQYNATSPGDGATALTSPINLSFAAISATTTVFPTKISFRLMLAPQFVP